MVVFFTLIVENVKLLLDFIRAGFVGNNIPTDTVAFFLFLVKLLFKLF